MLVENCDFCISLAFCVSVRGEVPVAVLSSRLVWKKTRIVDTWFELDRYGPERRSASFF